MSELKGQVGQFNTEFAKLQEAFRDALGLLKGEPEFHMVKDLTDEMNAKHKEWVQLMNPAIDWLEQEEKELKQGLADAEKRIAEVEQQLNAALAEAEKPQPEPEAPPPPLVPGEGNPQYGFELGAELLALIGLGSAAAAEKGGPKLGDVWQLESVDWKVDSAAPEPPPASSPAPARPAQPPRKPAPDRDQSIGQSIDFSE